MEICPMCGFDQIETLDNGYRCCRCGTTQNSHGTTTYDPEWVDEARDQAEREEENQR